MLIFKALAISAMAMVYPRTGDGDGIGLVGAVNPPVLDDKGSEMLHKASKSEEDSAVADAAVTDLKDDGYSKYDAFGALKRLRGAGLGLLEEEAKLLSEQEKAKATYLHMMTEQSLTKMHQDYHASELNGDPNKELPSYEEVLQVYQLMYESFQGKRNSPGESMSMDYDDESSMSMDYDEYGSMSMQYTLDHDDANHSSGKASSFRNVSEDEALLFINGRMTENEWSDTFREVMVCEDMFTSEDTGLQIEDVYDMTLTLEDMKSVSQACYHERISANLKALGYDPETFCPMFETVLPLQFQVLGEVITSNVTSFCSFLVDAVFESAGEPECYRRMEEVQLTDAIRQGGRYAFPRIVDTSTFNSSFISVCTSHNEPFFYDPENCTTSMDAVIQASTLFEPGNETMISYLSNLCDAFGLPVPHPNETIRLRYVDKHVHHKPGGKPNLKLRHMMSDLFNYVGHYKHGFINKYGTAIDNPHDTLLDPEVEFIAASNCDTDAKLLNKDMTCEQKAMYCSGLAFSVGAGGGASVGPISIGGGVDFGFGVGDDTGTKYEETFVWSICMSGADAIHQVDSATADSRKTDRRKKMEANDLGVSVGVSAGAWTNTGHLPGAAETISVTVTILVVDVGFTIVETFADKWVTSNGFHGFMIEVGGSFPPNGPLNVDLDQAMCWGDTITSADNANPKFPRQYDINVENRFKYEVCGDNVYSFNIESNTGVSGSETRTGLSLYYYKNKSDWDNRKITAWIVDYCGDPFGNYKLTTMGHGDHFVTDQVYGVGIAAHGDDAYTLGHASLYQALGGNKWLPRYIAKGLKLCISTNDPNCYPNIEIKLADEGTEEKDGNDAIIWRYGHHRVRPEKRCNKSEVISAGNYCEDYCSGGITNNYSCGGTNKITMNRCGSKNSDKVWNIDEGAACKSCATSLQNQGLIYSGWTCSARPLHQQNINYNPVKKYRTVYGSETCSKGYVYCKGEHSRSLKIYIHRDGKSHQDRLYDIPGGWSWEVNADKCCSWLRSNGYVSSCSRKHVGTGMDIKYTSTRSGCKTPSWQEEICDWQYNKSCGNDMSIKVLNPCGTSNNDGVNGLWDGGCKECGNYLVDKGDIKSSFTCKNMGASGMYLEYSPIEPIAQKCSDVKMLFDPAYWRHSNTIDNLADGLSWEGGCDHAGKEFERRGLIEAGWTCEKNSPATSIWLNYKPKPDWWHVSSYKAASKRDMCEYRIAMKDQEWCKNLPIEITVCADDGEPYISCSEGRMRCSDGKTDNIRCEAGTSLAFFEDRQHDTCVNGYNIIQLTGQSPESCALECLKYGSSCVGIEYYYETQKCNLSSSANTAGCNGAYWKVDFYKRILGENVSLLELGDKNNSIQLA